MSLLVLLNPKQFNVIAAGGHFPTVYVPLWGKPKRKKKKAWKDLILEYMREDRSAPELPKEFIAEFAAKQNTSIDRVMADWQAMMIVRRAEIVKFRKRQQEDEELILLYLLADQ